MKVETEIAKEKIDEITFFERDGSRDREGRAEALGIKQSYQRFLDFITEVNNQREQDELEDKITDLKQAIKEYENNGI